MNRLPRLLSHLPLPLVILATVLLWVGAASAGTPSKNQIEGVEGVWSFNGGQIAVQSLSNGTYAGTVVAETKFASCAHPVGQQIWTGIKEQKDGSYWGLHQWYFGNCQENPVRGPTAWRILKESNGSRYMRVCFSNPGGPQPMIAANGAPKGQSEYSAYHVTYGCYNSALIAPLPVTPGTKGTSGSSGGSPSVETLTVPNSKKCLGVKSLSIRLRDPRYDPFKKVTITFRGHRVPTSHKGHYVVATIKLKGTSTGTFTIKIRAVTVLGHHLSTVRIYHICTKRTKPKPHKKAHEHSHKKG